MKHSIDPYRASIMLDLCHDGYNIYEVIYRVKSGAVGYEFSQAKSAREAEKRALKIPSVVSAVARKLRR